jgi:hypothetical protein
MTNDDEMMMRLAERLEACAEDAKRPDPLYGGDILRNQPPSVISLANGLEAIAADIRARISETKKDRDNG